MKGARERRDEDKRKSGGRDCLEALKWNIIPKE
jgi:hypothetical protein